MPAQKPHRSKQDYETPDDFMRAVKKKFGAPTVDLAARADNAKAQAYISPEDDSLAVPWRTRAILGSYSALAWLNPEYADIAPWARKCHEQRAGGGRILLLVPASVGSNWFRDYVHGEAFVWALNGRLTFKSQTSPYPKDCILCEYGRMPGFDVWDWRADALK